MKKFVTGFRIVVAGMFMALLTWYVLGVICLRLYAYVEKIDISDPSYTDYGFGMAWALISVPLLCVLFPLGFCISRRLMQKSDRASRQQ